MSEAARANAVEVHDLVKQFGPVVAVDHVTFDIRAAELFGMLGPNGSGKTTTIRMLCGLLAPTSGAAVVAGVDVTRDPDRVKSKIGYMSQAFGLYGDLSVDENLRFYGGVYGLDRELPERIAWAKGRMYLEQFGDRPNRPRLNVTVAHTVSKPSVTSSCGTSPIRARVAR